jgi:Na+/H+ antiporter NhaD/arsenite permease-like protein
MALLAALIFIGGYALITFEHRYRVNKSITATALAAVLWGLIALSGDAHLGETLHALSAETFALVVFLLAAMTLVEILVHYRFFDLLRVRLFKLGLKDDMQLVLISTIAFFLSAVIDNLTTTIVMVQIARRFFKGKNLLIAVGSIVIAANAGGAFSPIGDVTTIMLWLAGKFSALDVLAWGFIPSLALFITSVLLFKRQLVRDSSDDAPQTFENISLSRSEKVVILATFASFALPPLAHLAHLPPFMGLLLGVGIVGLIIGFFANAISRRESHLSLEIEKIIGKVDVTSLLFFIGILFAVGALGHLGILATLSVSLFGDSPELWRLIGGSVLLGVFSAIVDNIPLTAAAMEILTTSDPRLWVLLALCAGTGGSMLAIGSAAGVVAMGMVKELTFKSYFKIATLPAAIGYAVAIIVWLIQYWLFS